jgi:uncharacterized repeat protein (TIGR01451 family)
MTDPRKNVIRFLICLVVAIVSLAFALVLPVAAHAWLRPSQTVTGQTTAEIDSPAPDRDKPQPGDAETRDTVIQLPVGGAPTRDMRVVKSLYSGRAESGLSLIYQITFMNQGNSPAADVIVTDTLPPNVTYVNNPYCAITPTVAAGGTLVWKVGTVTPGGTGYLYAQVRITDTAPVGSVLTNVVRVSTRDVDIDSTNDVYTLTTTVTAPTRDVGVSKSTSGPAFAGQDLQYYISYYNQGSLTATNIIITDVLPISVTYLSHSASGATTVVTGSMLVLTRSTLAGDAGGFVSILVHIANDAQVGQVLTNVARISTSDVDANLSNNVYTHTIPIATLTRDMYVSKSAIGGAARAGSLITYEIGFSNEGNYTATDVVLTDTLPANTSLVSWSGYMYNPSYTDLTSAVTPTVSGNQVIWKLGALGRDAYGYIRPTVLVTTAAPNGAFLPNQADISTGDPETDYSNNTSVVAMTVTPFCGPDASGYTCKDDTMPGGPAFNWVDATDGDKSYIAGDDRYDGPISVGFDLFFYGGGYSELYLSTNGLATFGGGSTAYTNRPLPYSLAPTNLAAPFWDDLQVCANQAIYYKRGGTAPNRYFVAEWANVSKLGDPTNPLTFEVVLYETGQILYQYQSLTGTLDSNSVGIENSRGDTGLQYSFNQAQLVDGRAILFIPDIKRVFLPVILKN